MKVFLTDHPWPDVAIERGIFDAAGFEFTSGPPVARPVDEIARLVAAFQPNAIMTCWALVSADVIATAPGLRIVQRMGVGLDNIDLAAAAARGVVVTNVPDYCAEELSDHAVALLLSLARAMPDLDRAVKAGIWDSGRQGLRRVRDMTVGLVGYGRSGRLAAAKLAGFGVRLLAHSPSYRGDDIAQAVSLDELLGASDAVLVHAPLTPQTHHMFDDAGIARMKPGALLINITRGGLIDNAALERALDSGHLAGAGLDVVEGEPEPPPSLVRRANVVVTPHVAYSSAESITELRTRGAQEVVRVLRGEAPEHPCPPPVAV